VSVYIYTGMTSKNLTVKEEVYNKLLEAKMNNESFSDVIERLLEGKRDLMSFAGIFSNDKKFEEAVKDILEVRKKTTLRKLS
jgi:predicted CopG family antitoxin